MLPIKRQRSPPKPVTNENGIVRQDEMGLEYRHQAKRARQPSRIRSFYERMWGLFSFFSPKKDEKNSPTENEAKDELDIVEVAAPETTPPQKLRRALELPNNVSLCHDLLQTTGMFPFVACWFITSPHSLVEVKEEEGRADLIVSDMNHRLQLCDMKAGAEEAELSALMGGLSLTPSLLKQHQRRSQDLDEVIQQKRLQAAWLRAAKQVDWEEFVESWLTEFATREALLLVKHMPLNDEAKREAHELLNGARWNSLDVVIDMFNIDLTRKKLACLRPGRWLNDEVVNFYLELLQERNRKEVEMYEALVAAGQRPLYQPPRVHLWNSFFYTKLYNQKQGYLYRNVRRWSKRHRVDMLALDKVIIPIHLGSHWCLAVLNVQWQTVEYYDSFGHANAVCARNCLQYLRDESLQYRKQALDTTHWTFPDVHTPSQENGSDCGMFMLKCADFVSQDLPLDFTQSDIPKFRAKMAWEIANGKLLS